MVRADGLVGELDVLAEGTGRHERRVGEQRVAGADERERDEQEEADAALHLRAHVASSAFVFTFGSSTTFEKSSTVEGDEDEQRREDRRADDDEGDLFVLRGEHVQHARSTSR